MLLIFFCSIINFFSPSNEDHHFNLDGRIEDSYNGKIFLLYTNESDKFCLDSCTVINGIFSFEGFVKEPTKAEVLTGKNFNTIISGRSIYLEPNNLKFYTQNKYLFQIRVSGSATQKEFENMYQPIDSLRYVIDSLNENDRKNKRIDTLEKKLTYKWNLLDSMYVIKHPKSWIAANIVYQNVVRYQAVNFYPADQLYSKFSEQIKSSYIGRQIKKAIDDDVKIPNGTTFNSFKHIDINQKQWNFDAGNNYLIYFWGTWCGSCKSISPYLTKYSNEFSNKGLKIVCVAVDDSLEILKKVILEENKAAFINLLDNDNYLNKMFNVSGYPTLFLIDKNRVLIGKYSIGEHYGFGSMQRLESDLTQLFE